MRVLLVVGGGGVEGLGSVVCQRSVTSSEFELVWVCSLRGLGVTGRLGG